jgi:hypothetical protein
MLLYNIFFGGWLDIRRSLIRIKKKELNFFRTTINLEFIWDEYIYA